MNPELVSRLDEVVERLVLEDRPTEDVLHRLQVNGVTGEEAEAFIRRAKLKRSSILRRKGMRLLLQGMIFLVLGSAVVTLMWVNAQEGRYLAQANAMTLAGGVACIFGAWKTALGLVGIAFHASHPGPVEE